MNKVKRSDRFACALHPSLRLCHCLVAAIAWAMASGAGAQPAQRPLLVNAVGAKPNFMITLDNSASMAAPYDGAYQVRMPGYAKILTDPQIRATRSAEFNSIYYNPRFNYEPRVAADGTPFLPTDDIAFISNQGLVAYNYDLYAASYDEYYLGSEGYMVEAAFPRKKDLIPAGWIRVNGGSSDFAIPKHLTYTQTEIQGDVPAFTYVTCRDKIISFSIGCTDAKVVNVTPGMSAAIELPAGNKRKCKNATSAGGTCTAAEEIQNILNWYRYYSTRIRAAQTAIGQAFQSVKLKDDTLRVGFMHMNQGLWPIDLTPGKDTEHLQFLRGVRPWVKKSDDNEQFYRWLYRTLPGGQTPLHNSFDKVASYFKVEAGAKENPWTTDPSKLASDTNPELSCRRSYQAIFSDGGWSPNAQNVAIHIGDDSDKKIGSRFPKGTATTTTDSDFYYRPKGIEDDRQAYTPYAGPATGGLADLAAQYYWHTDFRPLLANDVPTSPGQPTYWQNLRTYTIGYLIQASGELPGALSGLTFNQIKQYEADYLKTAKPLADLTLPQWPTDPMGGLQTSDENKRVDDFIQAGYTGGGRGFSVSSAEDIRSTIETILLDIFNSTGNDAGTDFGINANATNSLDGRLQYFVDYKTLDNSGNISAKKVDAKGSAKNGETVWSAKDQLPPYDTRRVYSLTGTNTGVEFKGRLDALDADIRTALQAGTQSGLLPKDSSFVDYLRGKRGVTDTSNNPYRDRASQIGAIVNSPPLHLSRAMNLHYDSAKSTVDGHRSFNAYRQRLKQSKATLLVASNLGEVHTLDADTGAELAAFMPRRSMRGLLDQADPRAEFRYVLDGPINPQDVYVGGMWQQLAFGTGGRGERVVYGLRMPIHEDKSRTPDKTDFLWETGPDKVNTKDFAMGYMTNEANGGQTDSGRWVVVLNSGHHNGSETGVGHGLLVLDAITGEVIRTIPLPESFPAGAGLGTVSLVRNTQTRIVAAYAGDANGQLWRFDLRGDPSNWHVSYNKPLFQTPNQRPIYGGPAWVAHPKGGYVVVVATGKLLDETDEVDVSKREGVFGIWDPTSRATGEEKSGFETVQLDQLLEQKAIETRIKTKEGESTFADSTRYTIDWTKHRGWMRMLGGVDDGTGKLALPGERVIDNIKNFGSTIEVNAVIIDRSKREESCQSQDPPTPLYAFNTLDGVAKPAFDVNGDGIPDVAVLMREDGGFARNIAVVSLRSEDDGSPAQQGFNPQDGLRGEPPGDPENTDCVAQDLLLAGVKGDPVRLKVSCTRSWSRQQYQLTQVPR